MRARHVVMVGLAALLVGGGCGRGARGKAAPDTAGSSSRVAREGKAHPGGRAPESTPERKAATDAPGSPSRVAAKGEVYRSGRIPKSTWTCVGQLEVLQGAADEKAIAAWAKQLPFGAVYLKGAVRDHPEESFVVVAYDPASGLTWWNVHLFRSHRGGEWRGTALLSGLRFKDQGTRISSAEMPDPDTLVLRDKQGNELVRFRL